MRRTTLELHSERKDRETGVAVIRIENVDTGRYLLVHELCEQTTLDISTALKGLRALADKAEAHPVPRSKTELAPRNTDVTENILNLEKNDLLTDSFDVFLKVK